MSYTPDQIADQLRPMLPEVLGRCLDDAHREIARLRAQLADREAKWGPPPTPGRWLVRSKFPSGRWGRWEDESLAEYNLSAMSKQPRLFQHAPCPDEPEEHGLPEGCE